MKKKLITAIIALTLVLTSVAGITVAWLSVETKPVENVFTYGDINITLTETEREYKMIPGTILPKDPTVTVKANSEACWLFIKVEKVNNPDTYLSYSIDTSVWTALPGAEGVYYCEVAAVDKDTPYPVLTGNEVVVKEEITKGQLTAIGTAYPKLVFTAYAVQKANVASAQKAWEIANGSN